MFELEVSKTHIRLLEGETLVSGAVNTYTCAFHFSPDWEGMEKTAVFRTGEAHISVPLLGREVCPIPWEVLTTPARYLQVGVFGTKNGDVTLPTIWKTLGAIQLGAALGEAESAPPEDVYDRILRAATEAVREVDDLREELAEGGEEEVPEYWQGHLDTCAGAIRTAMGEAGRNKSAFFFYCDAHWSDNSGMSPRILRYLHRRTPINKTIFGGDIVGAEGEEPAAYLWQWRQAIRELPNHHSVAGNHDDGADSQFSRDWVYSWLLAPEEGGNVIPGGGLYYCIDEPWEKTRYLYLNTAAFDGVDENQLAFVREALLSTPTGWHIVAAAHSWYEPDYSQMDARPIPLAGYTPGVEALLNLFDGYNARTGDFAGCGARVEFCVGGHVHRDYTGRTAGGIPIVLCETDSRHIRGLYPYSAGTIQESAVSAIVADYGNNRLRVIRAGRGADFDVALRTAPVEPPLTYTNQIPLSLDFDGSIYNGTGYKDGVALGADGITENTDGVSLNSWITGLIPIQRGDVVRITNYFDKQRYQHEDYRYYQQLAFYNEDKTLNRYRYLYEFLDEGFLTGGFTWTGEGREGILTFTFEGGSTLFENARYFRLAHCHIPDNAERLDSIATAVVTVNQELPTA